MPGECAGSSSSSIVAGWSEPEQDYGAPITSYQLECSPAAQRMRSALSWQRAWSGMGLSCEASPSSSPWPWLTPGQSTGREVQPGLKGLGEYGKTAHTSLRLIHYTPLYITLYCFNACAVGWRPKKHLTADAPNHWRLLTRVKLGNVCRWRDCGRGGSMWCG